MKFFLKHKSILFSLFVIFLIAFCTRVLFLDRVPPGILNDEYKYIINAKAVWFTGSGIYGNWNPLSFQAEPKDVKDSELLPLVMAPAVGVVPFTLFYTKLPFALLGILDVFLLFIIANFLFDTPTAIVIGLLAAINPYLIMFSRSAYDVQVAMFFFLCGVTLLFWLKGWKILLSFIPFGLAFYGYVGLKVSFLPLVAGILFWFVWFKNRKEWKVYALLFLLCLCMVGVFIFQLKTSPAGARVGELIFPSSPQIAKTVIQERTESLSHNITALFVNKYGIWAHHVIGAYLDAFSLRTLFISGENSTHQSLYYMGYFYLFDLLFMLIGAVYLWIKKRKVFVFFAIIILMSPITGAVRTDDIGSHVMHAVLMFPVLVMLAGFGIMVTYTTILKKRLLVGILLGFIYAISFISFLQLYFLQMPFFNAKGLDLNSRILSNYVIREEPKQAVTVIANDPRAIFKLYLLYASKYNSREDVEKVRSIITKGDISKVYAIDGVTFMQADKHKPIPQAGTVIVEASIQTPPTDFFSQKPPLIVPILVDGGAVFKIYNDKTCSQYPLKSYPFGVTFSDLSVEKLPVQRFCETFITRYSNL